MSYLNLDWWRQAEQVAKDAVQEYSRELAEYWQAYREGGLDRDKFLPYQSNMEQAIKRYNLAATYALTAYDPAVTPPRSEARLTELFNDYNINMKTADDYVKAAHVALGLVEPEPSPTPEPSPPPEPEPAPSPINIDWFSIPSILAGALEWLKPSWDSGLNYIGEKFGGLQNAANSIIVALQNFWSGLAKSVSELIPRASDAYAEKASATVASILHGSEPWEDPLNRTMEEQAEIMQQQYREAMDAVLNAGPTEDINIFETRAKEWAATAFTQINRIKQYGVFAELATLGQVEGFFQYFSWIDQLDGGTELISRIHMLEQEKGLLIGFEQAMNAKYHLSIPPYQDLINMRVKEVITQDQFKRFLLMQGFSETFSDYLWTAHFEPASWTDFLTSMRRKRDVSWVDASGTTHSHKFGDDVADDEQVIRDLSVLVDYDDRYWSFFKERMYNDLTVREARWLLEGATVDTERLRDIVHRHGYRKDDEDLMVEMLRTFQSRPWRNRYLTALVSAYTNNVMPEQELRSTIMTEGFQPEIGDYAVKLGDLRKRVAAAGGEEAVKEKILTLTDLRRLYLADKLNETEFTNRLTAQNYAYDDIVLLLSLLNDQKTVEAEGKRPIELSIPELLNAWRYTEISEDTLRARLMLKGMSQGDVQILINTKCKQWEISPMAGQEGYSPPTAG